MITLLLILLCINIQNNLISSAGTSEKPILYLYVDKMPKYNEDGGLKNYLSSNLKWPYQIDVQGEVLVSFVVQKDGRVKDIKIEKHLVDVCDNEVVRVIESMKNWEPGELNSEKVDVKIYLPVDFTLHEKVR